VSVVRTDKDSSHKKLQLRVVAAISDAFEESKAKSFHLLSRTRDDDDYDDSKRKIDSLSSRLSANNLSIRRLRGK
jgi:hypothetical protein